MKVLMLIACSVVALSAAVATAAAAGTAVESRAVCNALRLDVGATAFTTAFKSDASCRAEATPFTLRTVAALRRACKGDTVCMTALAGTATNAARRIVLPTQTCTSRYGSVGLTKAYVSCLVSTFRAELNTAARITVTCTTRVKPSHFAGCLASVQPAPTPVQPVSPAQTTPASPTPAPVNRCDGGGTGYGPQVECPMAVPTS